MVFFVLFNNVYTNEFMFLTTYSDNFYVSKKIPSK